MYSCRTAIHAGSLRRHVLVASIRAYGNIKALQYIVLSYKIVMQHKPE
jgi:hypothetical protein